MFNTSLLLFCSFLPLVFSCRCPSDTRSQAICDSDSYSNLHSSIYKARIISSQCKCRLNGHTNRFSCIEVQNSDGTLPSSVLGLYECDNLPFVYSKCTDIIGSLGISNSSIVNDTVNVENVTCADNSYDLTPYIADEGGCVISRQPCYYTAIVEAVYKGNVQVGHLFNTSAAGGCRYNVLRVGESYIVGLRTLCCVIDNWSPFSSFSSSEIKILELGNCHTSTTDVTLMIIIGLIGLLPIAFFVFVITVIIIAIKQRPGASREDSRKTVTEVE